jgi:hypothetical protein
LKYYLFIDESGDHGLQTVDENFPVFVLCGIVFSNKDHLTFVEKMYRLKIEFWESKEVIFHSRDIRRCEKEFQILLDLEVKAKFYQQLNNIISESDYTVISAVIRKEEYIKKYGRLGNVYSVSLSFLIERAIFFLDSQPQNEPIELEIIVEKRGGREDAQLSHDYNNIYTKGTYYVKPERIHKYNTKFKSKRDNVNGLQLADLVAYPIANHIKDPQRVNLPYEIFKSKFYKNKGKLFGIKEFP